MWKGESQENKIHGGPGLERQIGGWHLGTHDFVATTASHLHGKNVFNITRKRLRCNFVWAHLHLIHYFQKNMWKGESGREWNPWGLRVGKPNWGGDTSGPTTLLLPLPPICLVFFFRTFREIAIQFCLGTYAFEPQENKIKWGWPPGWIWVVGGLKKKRQAPKTAHCEILDWLVLGVNS